MQRVLVTGASGFVGRALCETLSRRGMTVRRAVRASGSARKADAEVVEVGEIDANTQWQPALRSVHTVVHLAARTHVMQEHAADPLAEYRRVNVQGTTSLARAAAEAGVQRLVFLSSIKVNGEATGRSPFTECDPAAPEDAYGLSKWEAEEALRSIAATSPLEAVVLRAPLLYGPGVKGNFLSLMRAIRRGVPLPLKSIDNRRSLLYVENLTDAISQVLTHPAAAGQTYLLADDLGIATPDLVRRIALAFERPPRLLPCPPWLLKVAALAAGRKAAARRLTDSLQIDSGKIQRELGWRPASDLSAGLAATVRWYEQAFNHGGEAC